MTFPQDRERDHALSEVHSVLSKIQGLHPENLGSKHHLTEAINFEAAAPYFTHSKELAAQLGPDRLQLLPGKALHMLRALAHQVLSQATQVQQFKITENGAQEARDKLLKEIKVTHDQLVEASMLPVAYSSTQLENLARYELSAKNMLGAISEWTKEAQAGAEAVKSLAATTGVSSTARYFSQEADAQSAGAKRWGNYTGWMIVATLLAAVGTLAAVEFWEVDTTPKAVQLVAGKLLFISVLSFATVWCARNYRAHKHNETLNRHRAQSMSTFEAFVEGTSEPTVKDAVLVQIATAVFQAQGTGYDSSETAPQQTVLPGLLSKLGSQGD